MFSKTSAFVAENAVYVCTEGANGEKISVFENKRIRVDGGLRITISKYESGTPRRPEKPLILGRSGTQFVGMVTKLLDSYFVQLVKSDTNWLRYLSLVCSIKIWLSVLRHHLANLHILKFQYLWKEKRYLKVVKSY